MGMSGAKLTNACDRKNLSSLRVGLFVIGLGLTLEGPMVVAPVSAEGRPGHWVAQADAPNPATPNPEATPNPVLLGPGANPQEVMILQQQLTQLGLYSGPVDGDYSAATQEAVKAFQTSVNLAATGLLDSQTWEQMNTPQLFSEESAPEPEPEMPSLLPSSDAGAASGGSEAAASESEAPTATPPDAPEPEAPAPKSRLSLLRWVGPLLGLGLVAGAGWVWRKNRRHRHSPTDGATEASSPEAADSPEEVASHSSPLAEVSQAGGSSTVSTDQAAPPTPESSAASSSLPAAGPLATRSGPTSPSALADVGRLPTVNIVETLVGELASPDAAIRQRAIWELGQRGNSTAIQPLVNSLIEADSYEKSLIFAALGEIGHRSFQPMQRALMLGLKDPSPEVRKNAIRDLSRFYGSIAQIRPMLIHAAQDPDPEVQAVAQWALGRRPPHPAAPQMTPSPSERPISNDARPPLSS